MNRTTAIREGVSRQFKILASDFLWQPIFLFVVCLFFWNSSLATYYKLSGANKVYQFQGPMVEGITLQPLLQIKYISASQGGGDASDNSTITELVFELTGYDQILNAKLYYSGTATTLNTATDELTASVANPGSSTITFSSFASAKVFSSVTTVYFWLVVDVKTTGTTAGTVIDASYSSGTYGGNYGTPTLATPDPTGFRIIGDSYEIGTGGTYNHYATVGAAAAVINSANFLYDSGLADIYFELLTTTAESAITITYNSATTRVTFRPKAGKTGLVTAPTTITTIGSTDNFITLDGAKNVLFDGRPGGVGSAITDSQWTVRNTRTSSTVGGVFDFLNDANNCVCKYLVIEGEAQGNGLIEFGFTDGTTGNDDNTITYCLLQDLSSGGTTATPDYGIFSFGTDAKSNSGNTVSFCYFEDILYSNVANGSNIGLSVNNSNWTITDNHFYFAQTIPALTFVSYFIIIQDGGGYTISNNYMGGQAPSCGGGAYTATNAGNTSYMRPIFFNSAVSGASSTVRNNTIQNISFTTSYAGSAFIGIRLDGATDYVCGSVGAGNTIGKMDAAGSVLITNNVVTGSTGSMAIYCNASGTNSIAYNNMGGITFAGTRTGTDNAMIHLTNTASTTTVDNNIIGGTVDNSIDMTIDSELHGVYSENPTGITVTNNTFQNFRNRGADETMIVWNTDGVLNCSNNAFSDITADGNKKVYLIAHGSAADPEATTLVENATVNGNTFADITLSNTGGEAQLAPILVNSSGTIITNDNVIGSTTAGNISLAPASSHYGIFFKGNGSITCDDNVIQQFDLITTSVNTNFVGINNADGVLSSCDGNTIRNISSVGNKFHYMIYHVNTDDCSITNSVIHDISLTGTGASEFRAMMVSTSGTSVVSNNTIGSTSANNISLAGAAAQYGIYLDGNGSFTCDGNTIQQLNLTETSASSELRAIFNSNGTLTSCNSNVIKDITSAGGARQYGILNGAVTLDDNAVINSNAISNITLTSTTSGFYGIQSNSSGTIEINSNVVGSTTANNISCAGDNFNCGIRVLGAPVSLTVDGNTVQEFNMTNGGTTTEFNGVFVSSGTASALTISNNIITNIDNAGTQSGTILRGINFTTTGVSGVSIVSNIISNLRLTDATASSPRITGINLSSSRSGGNLKKNKLTGFSSTATGTPYIYGVYVKGSWDVHNNIILCTNGGNTNPLRLYGLYDLSEGTMNVMHNTISISGSSSSGAEPTRAYSNAAAGTKVVKNNIFQNLRTGGTSTHYSYRVTSGTGLTTDYNYIEVLADQNLLANWEGADLDFDTWKTTFSGEDNSLNGTNTIASNGSAAADFSGANEGDGSVFSGDLVVIDYAGTARDGAPWMGAFEGVVALPIELIGFSAYKKGMNNELSWSTFSEINNDFFSIEKTLDGIVYETVGEINGAGNSTNTLFYSLTDYDVRRTINYYRLKQTDFDGKNTYSKVVSVDNRSEADDSTKEIVTKMNLIGQEINESYRGIVLIFYSDGTTRKVIQ